MSVRVSRCRAILFRGKAGSLCVLSRRLNDTQYTMRIVDGPGATVTIMNNKNKKLINNKLTFRKAQYC